MPFPLLPEYVLVQVSFASFSLVVVIASLLERMTSRLDVGFRSLLLRYSMPMLRVPLYLSSLAVVSAFLLIVSEEPFAKHVCLFCLYSFFPTIAMATLQVLEGFREATV